MMMKINLNRMNIILKRRPLVCCLSRVFREEFSLNIFLAIDESMVTFKDRSSMKQFMPLKQTCYPITGYMIIFHIYEWKSTNNYDNDWDNVYSLTGFSAFSSCLEAC
jgi:hypothetical protein